MKINKIRIKKHKINSLIRNSKLFLIKIQKLMLKTNKKKRYLMMKMNNKKTII